MSNEQFPTGELVEKQQPVIDVSGWTPDQMINEHDRAEALAGAEEAATVKGAEANFLACEIEKAIAGEARRNSTVCRQLFDLLRTSEDWEHRFRATNFVMPMLIHDTVEGGPGPESTIEAWAKLLNDPENSMVIDEARILVMDLFHPSNEAIASLLTVHQMTSVLKNYYGLGR